MGFKIVEDRPTPAAVYNFKIYFTAIVIAWAACLFGYCASFIGTTITLPAFQADFGLDVKTATERSMISSNIVSVFQAGALVGAIAGYPSMELLGRRTTLMGTSLIFIVGAILSVVATNQLSLIYASRVLDGFAVGGITAVAPVYLSELSPPAIRGRLVGFYEIGYQMLAIVGFWLNYGIKLHMDLTKSATWKIGFGLQLVPGGLLLVGCFFLVESPRYLLKHGKAEKATSNLCWLRNLAPTDQYIEEELSATVVQIKREREVSAGQKGNAFVRYCRGMWGEVSAPGIRNRLIIGAFIMMWQNMSGINAINLYSPTLFKAIGITDTGLYTGIFGVLKAVASLVFFIFLVDTWGRRSPLMFGGLTSGLCLLYVAIYLKLGDPAAQAIVSQSTIEGGKGATAFILLFGVFYCLGWNGLAWVICAEIYPTRIRGFCAAWTAMWQWVWQLIIARETTAWFDSLGWGLFLLFAIFNFASVVFTFFFIPETKGRTLEDMDSIFGYVHPDERQGKKVRKEETHVEDTLQVHTPPNGSIHEAPKQDKEIV